MLRTANMGHFDPFPLPRLNGRCPFSYPTFAGTRGNDGNAPKPAARIMRLELTRACRQLRRSSVPFRLLSGPSLDVVMRFLLVSQAMAASNQAARAAVIVASS